MNGNRVRSAKDLADGAPQARKNCRHDCRKKSDLDGRIYNEITNLLVFAPSFTRSPKTQERMKSLLDAVWYIREEKL